MDRKQVDSYLVDDLLVVSQRFSQHPIKLKQDFGTRNTTSMQVTSMLVLRVIQSNNKIQRPGAIIPTSAERCCPPLILNVRDSRSLSTGAALLSPWEICWTLR